MTELPIRDASLAYLRNRIKVAIVIMLLAMGLLAARLWQLQLLRGESFIEMSQGNRVRVVRLPPPRGKIVDSAGHVVAENSPSFTFSIIPGELKDPQRLIRTCSDALGMTPEKLRGLLERSGTIPRFMAFPLKRNMSLEEVSLLKSQVTDLKGVSLEARPRRVYPWEETLCHVAGTLGEISPEALAKGPKLGYQAGDLLGKSGIEKEYETHLKGEEGWEKIEIDAKGRQLGVVSRQAPQPGADVILTVDAEFQRYAEDVFIHRAGSIVAVEPDTGRILAMVSKPGFDLNLFSPSISERQWKALNSDPLHPLENRSTRGLYSPASTFKIVTAAAGLAEDRIDPQHRFSCKGSLDLRGQVFRCWNHYGHGKVGLHRAIVESCDIYFYELGLRLGGDRIARWASHFGLGQPTGIGLPQELPGLLPTSAWKLRTYGEPWKDGETVTLAIGQGYLVSTPVQLAMMTAALANGGKLLKPAIVQKVVSLDGKMIFDHQPLVRSTLPLDRGAFSLLSEAMRDVVSDKRGTGKRCRIPGLNIKAKTGTSQVIRIKERIAEEDRIPYHERTHAIFVAYVDDQPKKFALVVIVEHGGGGGASAAPIARKIIARYYGRPDPGDPSD
ncbi:MAG: penicillin-binding protein 2 [Desulfomonile tiedjei]|nr:penicillin-binding protein 2 [Desulfomonile tiedjei]